MVPTQKHLRLPACEALSPSACEALLVSARTLQQAAAAGRIQPLLRGKNLGLLCEDDAQHTAMLFRRAASELGAHVAHIRPSLSERSAAQDLHYTARMLGRLYDALECQGIAPQVVQHFAAEAGVPVFAGIATPQHPSAALALRLVAIDEAEQRHFLLQALLLSAIG